MATPENKVKLEVKKYLKTLGSDVWWFMPVPGGFGTNGVPDFIICYRGRFIGLETKAPGKLSGTTPLQRMQLGGIQKSGGYSLVADSVAPLAKVVALIDAELCKLKGASNG